MSLSGWFLKKGDVVTIEDTGSEREQKIYKSEGPSRLLSYPTVVLINEGSASASEILAGALQVNNQTVIIGEKSFGKGFVQEEITLSEGAVHITTSEWLLPNGESIDQKGLTPEIKVELTDKDFKAGRDPQLDKAKEVLNKQLVGNN